MKRILFGFFIAVVISAGCVGETGYKSISPQEVKSLLEAQDVFLLDVHVPEQRHISGTDAFIPYDAIEKYAERLPENKNTVIVIYCMSGVMSKTAADKLLNMGYKNVYDLKGGIMAWKNAGHALDEAQGQR